MYCICWGFVRSHLPSDAELIAPDSISFQFNLNLSAHCARLGEDQHDGPLQSFVLLPEFFAPALGTLSLANTVLEVLCSSGFKFANDEQRKHWAAPLAKLRSSATSSSILRDSKCISTSALLLQLCDARAQHKHAIARKRREP